MNGNMDDTSIQYPNYMTKIRPFVIWKYFRFRGGAIIELFNLLGKEIIIIYLEMLNLFEKYKTQCSEPGQLYHIMCFQVSSIIPILGYVRLIKG